MIQIHRDHRDPEIQSVRRGRFSALTDSAVCLVASEGGPDRSLERLLPELNDRSFADLAIPLKVVATDLAAHETVVIEHGNLRRAVAARPGYPDLHALLGANELRAGQLDDGIASLADALCLNPDFHEARYQLALGLEARGQREEALAEVTLLLAAVPTHPGASALRDRLGSRRRAPSGGAR